MACSILILMWVYHELGYDRFHPDHRDISRMGFRIDMLGTSLEAPLAMAPLAGVLKTDFPEVDDAVRINVPENVNVTVNSEHYTESLILIADSANPPSNSHIAFSGVASFSSLYGIYPPGSMDQWLNISYFTYLKFNRDYDSDRFFSKLEELFEDRYGADAREFGISLDPFLQPVTAIHLGSNMIVELSAPGNKTTVYIFLAISVFILILACINFMNLSVARASMRSKEVGVRKVNGASKRDLISQFLGESIIFSLAAILVAIPLIQLGLPYFNNITGQEFSFFSLSNLHILIILPLFVIAAGLIAGSYPAFVLSAGNPLKIIKGGSVAPSGKSRLRSGLIIFQLIISITLMISTFFVWKQLDFINSKDLGFDKSNKIIVQLISNEQRARHASIKHHILGVSGVMDITMSSSYPGMEFSATVYRPDGFDEDIIVNFMWADHSYSDVMAIRIIEGRNFDPAFPTDSMAVLVTETAAREFGWTDPLNMTITRGKDEGAEMYRIIGVIGDFHFRSIHRKVEPLVVHHLNVLPRYMTIHASPANFPVTLSGIKSAWHEVNPGQPFEFTMLSDAYDIHYRAERQLSRIFTYFSILAFLIASLGMYGIASFMAGSRTREIGIRKVFGAPAGRIMFDFFRQFGLWLLLANIVAWVLGFYFMDRWLDPFAYKISLWDPVVYTGAALISAVIVLVAAGSQSLKAAYTNPADSLRHE